MPVVTLPNGQRVRFPDGVSEEQISATLTADYPQFSQQRQPGDVLPDDARELDRPRTTAGGEPLSLPSGAAMLAHTADAAKQAYEGMVTPLVQIVPQTSREGAAAWMSNLGRTQPPGVYVPSIAQTPDIPPDSAAAGVLAGGASAVADLANFFTSPLGIATLGMGALPATARQVISLAFAADMARHTPELARELGAELGKPEAERDPERISYLLTSGTGHTLFTALAGKHGLTTPRQQMINRLSGQLRSGEMGTPAGRGVTPLVRPGERAQPPLDMARGEIPFERLPETALPPIREPGMREMEYAGGEMPRYSSLTGMAGGPTVTKAGAETITGFNVREGTEMPAEAGEIPVPPPASSRKSSYTNQRPHDLIDEVEGQIGKISWKLIKEANPDWKPVGAARKLFAADGIPADVAADVMAKRGLYKGDPGQPDQFGAALNAVALDRKGRRTTGPAESQQLRIEERQATQFGERVLEGKRPKAEQKNVERVDVTDLTEGDTFLVQGNKFTVERPVFDADGNLVSMTLKDGPKFGVQTIEGRELLHIDKGSFKATDQGVEWLSPAELADPAPPSLPRLTGEAGALTRAEQAGFERLTAQLRAHREQQGPPLTTAETQVYDALLAKVGQGELLNAAGTQGVTARLTELQARLAQLDKLRLSTQDRAWESRHRRDELLGEARAYEQEMQRVRENIRELQTPTLPQQGDMLGLGGAVGMPPIPPGVASGVHGSVMPVAMDRLTPGTMDVPTVMRHIQNVVATVGSQAPIRTGRFGGDYLGIFKTWADVIRLREANDIPTAAHEAAHAVANQVFGSPKSNPMIGRNAQGRPLLNPSQSIVQDRAAIAELRAKGRALYGSRRPAAGYTAEGFSEFVREWMTTEDVARRMPATSKWFNDVLLKNEPDLARSLTTAREAIDVWRGQGALGRAQAQMQSPPGRLKQLLGHVRETMGLRGMVEEFQPLLELSRGYQKVTGHKLRPSQDPYLLASAKRGSAGQVLENFVERGVQDVWGNTTGPSLKEALFGRVKPHEADRFAAYLWARRAQERWAQDKNPGMAREDAAYLRQQLETPDFIEAARGYYRWWDGVLEYVKQGSPEMNGPVVDAIRAGSRDYAPLARVLPESVKRAAQERLGGGLYRMHGSGLPIQDIYLQSLLVAERMIQKAHRDMVLDSVFRLSKTEGMGWLVERVPRDKVRQEVNIEKLRQQLDAFGVDTSKIPPDSLLNFYQFAEQPRGVDPIMVRRTAAGTEWYQVPAKLFETLQGMEGVRFGWAADLLLGMPSRAFKLGTTGLRASFSLFTNPARDIVSFYHQSLAGNPWRQTMEYFGSLQNIIAAGLTGKESPAWAQFKKLGIQSGTFLGGDIGHAKREARSLFRGKVFRRVASPVETLREAFSVTEGGPRLAEMSLVGRELGWKPGDRLTPDQSVAMGVAGKRVTTDFSAGGRYGKWVNQAVPFFNPAIQGQRAFARAWKTDQGWKDKPQALAKATLTGLSMLTVPTLFNWWRNKDEEWYRNLPWRERYLYTNVEGPDGVIVQVPRQQEWGSLFQVVPEMLLDTIYQRDPEYAVQGLAHIFDVNNMVDYPVLLRTAKEQWQNRIAFFERPIVPRSELDLPPGDQRAYFSSLLATALGDAFPNRVSPRRVDAAVRSIFGGVGGDLMDAPGELLRVMGVAEQREWEAADVPVVGRAFRRGGQFTGNSRYMADFWDAYLMSLGQRNAAQRALAAGQEPRLTALEYQRGRILQDHHAVLKLHLEMAHRAEKQEDRNRLYRQASRIAKAGVETAARVK